MKIEFKEPQYIYFYNTRNGVRISLQYLNTEDYIGKIKLEVGEEALECEWCKSREVNFDEEDEQ